MIREIKKDMGDALKSLVPEAKYIIRNNIKEKTYNLEWIDGEVTQPTQAEIDAEVIRLQEEYYAQEYARNREEAYPSTGDQLDYMYHNGFEKWKTDMIDPVKDKYPKG